jgi:aspartate racemase
VDELGPVLGIIGGAGVGAAARLYVDVAARVRAATGSLPRIALWNVPFSDTLEHAFTSATPNLDVRAEAEGHVGEAVDRLRAAGATVIAMPCNSLQRAAARECEQRSVPFIDMIAATMDAARTDTPSLAVLIATEGTEAAGYYEGYGVEIVAPSADARRRANALIARAVHGDLPGADEMRTVVELARRPGAGVVLGCTDICGLMGGETPRVVESLGCLVERCADALGAGAAV